MPSALEEGERHLVADLDVEERAEGLRRRQAEELAAKKSAAARGSLEWTMV